MHGVRCLLMQLLLFDIYLFIIIIITLFMCSMSCGLEEGMNSRLLKLSDVHMQDTIWA